MSFLRRLLNRRPKSQSMTALYRRIVERAREPRWYTDGAVADNIDGRFDMLALMMAMVLMRLDREGESLRQDAVELTEIFIDDMDGQMRQLGIGDFVVGKHVGKMMGALGGRMDAYGEGLVDGGDLASALVRNLYRGEAPAPDALAYVAAEIRKLHGAIMKQPLDQLLTGELGA